MEMKCSGDSQILQGLVHDTTRTSSCFFYFCIVSQTNSCSISESPLHLISFHVPDLEDSRCGEEVGDSGVEVANLGPHRTVAQLQEVHQPRGRSGL